MCSSARTTRSRRSGWRRWLVPPMSRATAHGLDGFGVPHGRAAPRDRPALRGERARARARVDRRSNYPAASERATPCLDTFTKLSGTRARRARFAGEKTASPDLRAKSSRARRQHPASSTAAFEASRGLSGPPRRAPAAALPLLNEPVTVAAVAGGRAGVLVAVALRRRLERLAQASRRPQPHVARHVHASRTLHDSGERTNRAARTARRSSGARERRAQPASSCPRRAPCRRALVACLAWRARRGVASVRRVVGLGVARLARVLLRHVARAARAAHRGELLGEAPRALVRVVAARVAAAHLRARRLRVCLPTSCRGRVLVALHRRDHAVSTSSPRQPSPRALQRWRLCVHRLVRRVRRALVGGPLFDARAVLVEAARARGARASTVAATRAAAARAPAARAACAPGTCERARRAARARSRMAQRRDGGVSHAAAAAPRPARRLERRRHHARSASRQRRRRCRSCALGRRDERLYHGLLLASRTRAPWARRHARRLQWPDRGRRGTTAAAAR